MTASGDGQHLLDAYLDGDLADADQAAFLDWLRADPAHRRAFVLASHLDRTLAEVRRPMPAAPASARRPTAPARPWPRSLFLRPLLVGAALAVATSLLVFAVPRPARPATAPADPGPAITAGAVTVDGRAGVPGDRPAAGARLEVAAGSVADLAWADGTRLTVQGGSALRLPGDGRHLDLAHGRLRAEVAPRPAGAPLLLVTGETALVVLGTAFTLAAGDGGTRLAVEHGHVRSTDLVTGAVRDVLAGDELSTPPADPVDGAPEVTGLTLVDADRGRPLLALGDGAVIDLAALPAGVRLNVRAETGTIRPGSVRFCVIADHSHRIDPTHTGNVNLEHRPPFQLVYNDNGSHLGAWTPGAGSFLLVATPFALGNARGAAGRPFIIGCTTRGERRQSASDASTLPHPPRNAP
jgi:ferric-dicitrate binding protein FerR (iron transport regulator)